MSSSSNLIKKYLCNCFLLTIPILVWNIALADQLPKAFQPDIFWKDIPAIVAYPENILRTIVFMLTVCMPLTISSSLSRKGLIVYLTGLLLYFTSWVILICWPDSEWSHSICGFLAPAVTPVCWLAGIGMMGNALYFNLPYRRWVFFLVSFLFLVAHNTHAFIVYSRLG